MIAAGWAAVVLLLLSLFVPALDGPSDAQERSNVLSFAFVEGTNLIALRPNGQRAEGTALIGTVIINSTVGHEQVAFRIDGVRVDPDDPEITLYDLSIRNPVTREWTPYCVPDSHGIVGGVFLAGSWDMRGTHLYDGRFSVSCTSGAIGKCVRAGYKPWQTAADKRPMWDYHQACVRAVRADYSGNGISHTREGTPIALFDRLDIQRPDPNPRGLTFEAAWGPDGAVCVRRTRIPELLSTDELARRYPHLAEKTGRDCSEEIPALIWNRS